jgi:selenocysteine-specific elongation factor
MLGLTKADAVAETGWTSQNMIGAISALTGMKWLRACGDVLLASTAFSEVQSSALKMVEAFQKANPLVAGINKDELRKKLTVHPDVFGAALAELMSANKLEVSGELVRMAGRGVTMDSAEAKARQTIEDAFRRAGLKVPYLKDVLATLPVDKVRAQKIVTLLLRDKVLVKFGDDLAFHIDTLNSLKKEVAAMKSAGVKSIDVGQFKDRFEITRKYAIPLLEHLDRERVTRREGDKRTIL